MMNCYEQINAFKDKLYLWCSKKEKKKERKKRGGGDYNFPSPEEIVGGNESSSLIPSVCGEIVAHLEELLESFDRYFDVGKLESFDILFMSLWPNV